MEVLSCSSCCRSQQAMEIVRKISFKGEVIKELQGKVLKLNEELRDKDRLLREQLERNISNGKQYEKRINELNREIEELRQENERLKTEQQSKAAGEDASTIIVREKDDSDGNAISDLTLKKLRGEEVKQQVDEKTEVVDEDNNELHGVHYNARN